MGVVGSNNRAMIERNAKNTILKVIVFEIMISVFAADSGLVPVGFNKDNKFTTPIAYG